MTVSDFIFADLKRRGVDTVFTLVGGLAMHLNEACRKAGFRMVCHHHELCCTIAADAYARQSGKLGVAMLTGGPGGPWGIGGIVAAWQDSSPMLVLVGQAKATSTIQSTESRCRQVGTFEVDFWTMVSSVTKYSEVIAPASVGFISYMIDSAMIGRPGPVVLEVPLDVQGAKVA